MTDPQTQQARDIHFTALQAVTDRFTQAEKDWPPAVAPIVAANIAMAAMLDQLLDLEVWYCWELLPELLDVCNPAAPDRARVRPPCTCLETGGEYCDRHGDRSVT
jgi:hypothetical protein